MQRKPKQKFQKKKDNSKSKNYSRRRRSDNMDDKSTDNVRIRDTNNSAIQLTSNDPSWYMHNETLAMNAGTIPFSYALGTRIPNYASSQFVMPGLFNMIMVPSFGAATRMTDPINIAAVKIYSYVRHENGGHANYDHPDLMMYILAMGQAYSAHEWMKRMYGYLNTYSVYNKYIPKAYAAADNIDFDDFLANLADFNYYINEVAVKLSAFAIPQNFDLFKRHRFLYSNIHTDDDTTRSSLYMFTPAGFYKYDNTTSETGTSLQWSAWSHTSTPKTFANLKSYMDDLLSTVFGDEDAGIMSGDILKAYGSEAIYSPGAIDFSYSVLPTYDPAILSQIQNAVSYGTVVPKPVSQTGNGVIQNQQLVNVTNNILAENSVYNLLTADVDNPTPGDVLEMTRLVCRKALISGRTDVVDILGGSELYSWGQIFIWDYSNSTYAVTNPLPTGYHALSAANVNSALNLAAILSKFNHHPNITLINDTDDGKSLVLGDLDNATSISYSQLDNLHMTALLSLFGV